MDPNIPVRAWRMSWEHLDVINKDVEGFKKVDEDGRSLAREYESLPVLGVVAPYTMVVVGFATEIPGTQWIESRGRFEPIDGTPLGDALRRRMSPLRFESEIFKALGIDNMINVNMPQNTMVVAPDFDQLPILVMYGLFPGVDPEFGLQGMKEMPLDQARALARWMEEAQ